MTKIQKSLLLMMLVISRAYLIELKIAENIPTGYQVHYITQSRAVSGKYYIIDRNDTTKKFSLRVKHIYRNSGGVLKIANLLEGENILKEKPSSSLIDLSFPALKTGVFFETGDNKLGGYFQSTNKVYFFDFTGAGFTQLAAGTQSISFDSLDFIYTSDVRDLSRVQYASNFIYALRDESKMKLLVIDGKIPSLKILKNTMPGLDDLDQFSTIYEVRKSGRESVYSIGGKDYVTFIKKDGTLTSSTQTTHLSGITPTTADAPINCYMKNKDSDEDYLLVGTIKIDTPDNLVEFFLPVFGWASSNRVLHVGGYTTPITFSLDPLQDIYRVEKIKGDGDSILIAGKKRSDGKDIIQFASLNGGISTFGIMKDKANADIAAIDLGTNSGILGLFYDSAHGFLFTYKPDETSITVTSIENGFGVSPTGTMPLECDPNCKTCQNTPTECTSCEDTFYFDSLAKDCKTCGIPLCQKCTKTGVNPLVCTQCQNDLIGANCDACAPGSYKDGTSCKLCSIGIPNCSLCSKISSNPVVCSTCVSNFDVSNTCSTCLSGFYKDGAACSSCSVIPKCLECSKAGLDPVQCSKCSDDFTGENCNVCKTGFYKDVSSCLLCSQAISNCQECSSNTNCTSCTGGLIGSTCSTCPPGKYKSGSSCLDLPFKCLQVINSKCICDSGYEPHSTNIECVIETSTGGGGGGGGENPPSSERKKAKLVNKHFSKKTLETTFEFNRFLEKTNLKDFVKVTIHKQQQTELLENAQIVYKDGDSSTLKIKIPEKSNIIGNNVKLSILLKPDLLYSSSPIIQKEGNQPQSPDNETSEEITFSFPSILIPDPSTISKVNTTKKILSGLSFTATAAAMIASPSAGILMIKMPQFFDFLDFFNIEFPQNLAYFLELFDNTLIKIIGQSILDFLKMVWLAPFKWLDPQSIQLFEYDYQCSPHQKIKENNLGCMFLGNSGVLLVQILFYGLAKWIFILFNKFTKAKIFSKINKKFGLKFFVGIAIAFQMDFLLAAFINLRHSITGHFVTIFSLILSLVCITFYMIFIGWMFKKSSFPQSTPNNNTTKLGQIEDMNKVNPQPKKSTQDNQKKGWRFLNMELKEKYQKSLRGPDFGRHILNLQNIRDFCFPLFMIIFLNSPTLQMVPLISIYTFTTVVLIKFRPFESKIENYVFLIQEICCTTILVSLSFLKIFEQKMSEEQRSNYIGYPLIIVISFVLISISLISIQKAGVAVYSSWKRWKLKKKNKKIDEPTERVCIKEPTKDTHHSSGKMNMNQFKSKNKRVTRQKNNISVNESQLNLNTPQTLVMSELERSGSSELIAPKGKLGSSQNLPIRKKRKRRRKKRLSLAQNIKMKKRKNKD